MNKHRALMVLGFSGLALAAMPAPAHAQALRPNVLILLDTSGSMLYGQALDGSPLCNDTMQHTTQGQSSRVYNMKNAIRAALAQVGTDEANFGLARFPQLENTGSTGCPAAHWSNGTTANCGTSTTCTAVGGNVGCKLTTQSSSAPETAYGTGWRLCTAAEWLDLCNGSGNTTFPYGGTYAAQSCNGYDYTKAAGVTTIPTGMAGACVSDQSTATGDELYDMSGNVKEWVLSTTATAGPYEMRGGAYNVASFTVGGVTSAPGLQCDASVPAPAAPTDVRLPSVGFRCCMTGQLPP
jgi:hypothetical protein